jgi:CheY-like chemotaxis protein
MTRFIPQTLEPASSEVSGTGNRKPRVLVVDDELLIADSIAQILNGSGFEAVAAYGGQSAIEVAQEFCPDILLTDVLMPRVNGVEAAIAVRKSCPEARILLFSGQAATADILQNARLRGYDFELVPKPIHPQQLLKTLRT